MILVFDLDDTLYDESTYVNSGMHAVARYLAPVVGQSEKKVHTLLVSILEAKGRGSVFDEALNQYGIYSKKRVAQCVGVYRHHTPDIHLSNEALNCLKRFKQVSKYIVTDGHKLVQKNKADALKVKDWVKHVYRTYQYGIKYSKPSTYCFDLISKRERVDAGQIIYIGDNPKKDFIQLKEKGYKTIRVRQGMFKNLTLDKKHEAHLEINNLNELTFDLVEKLIARKK